MTENRSLIYHIDWQSGAIECVFFLAAFMFRIFEGRIPVHGWQCKSEASVPCKICQPSSAVRRNHFERKRSWKANDLLFYILLGIIIIIRSKNKQTMAKSNKCFRAFFIAFSHIHCDARHCAWRDRVDLIFNHFSLIAFMCNLWTIDDRSDADDGRSCRSTMFAIDRVSHEP